MSDKIDDGRRESAQLVRYDAMCQAIDRAFEVDEVKDIHDKAVALEAYFRQAKNPEPERRAIEIRLRAERKAGQLLKVMEKHPPGPDRLGKPRDLPRKLSELGISYYQSHIWQQLADVPEAEFEAALAAPGKPSTSGILETQPLKQTRTDPMALWLWGTLKDFEREGILDADPERLMLQMSDHMRTTTLRLAPQVRAWLECLK